MKYHVMHRIYGQDGITVANSGIAYDVYTALSVMRVLRATYAPADYWLVPA